MKRKPRPGKTVKLAQFITSNTRHSRRDLLDLVDSGRVTVNNSPVSQLNLEINPGKDVLKIADEPIRHSKALVYLFNKPAGVISTLSDPKGRKCLGDIIGQLPEGVKPVGRLDRNTSGLMIFTNDGNLAQQLNHPSQHVEKTYNVGLDTPIRQADLQRLKTGFFLEDGPVRFISCTPTDTYHLTIVIAEGRNRIVRRSFEFLGYQVKTLKRTTIGPYQLGRLALGQFQKL